MLNERERELGREVERSIERKTKIKIERDRENDPKRGFDTKRTIYPPFSVECENIITRIRKRVSAIAVFRTHIIQC